MNLIATFKKHNLIFKREAKTSRDILLEKPGYFLTMEDIDSGLKGIGECSIIKGLSIDDEEQMEPILHALCEEINTTQKLFPDLDLSAFPAIRFGLETALMDLNQGGLRCLFKSSFYMGKRGIPVNGLIWMGDLEFMKEQVIEKLEQGYNCLKLKIGALNFEDELSLIRDIRREFSAQEIMLRVDANGSFSVEEASEKLKRLADLDIHSIEQPIHAGQFDEMAELCLKSPLPVALDEELIGIENITEKKLLLNHIKPQFLILKPSLLGGFRACDDWIALAQKNRIGWWATSALESNIGLNAIAQWVSSKTIRTHQGLGTGQLYSNNIPSPLSISGGHLYYNEKGKWDFKGLEL